MLHKHKAKPEKQTFAGWDTCVTPDKCAANPQRQSAHGSVIYYDRCSCGAVRLSESNNGSVNRGRWLPAEYEAYLNQILCAE